MSKPPPPRPPSATPAAPAAGPAGAVERPALKTPAQPGVAGVNPAAMAPGGAPPPGGRVPDGFRVSAPTVSMPRGGGGLASIGEKFEANPVTGGGSYTIPLPASPGRAGQPGPGLALRYSSGGGNGPFGMGWSLDLPSIRRKTDRGLPRYRDSGDEADVFVLAGAEDLVPHLSPDGSGGWVPSVRTWSDGVHTWTVTRYRPRVEAQSQLIERFSRPGAAPFWRTVGANNTRRLFGWSPQARVVDPDDPRRVFEWLLEEEADERGHVVSYQYDLDDGADARGIFEAGRAREGERVTYRHLRRVSYGNSAPFQNPDRPAGLAAPDTWSAAGRGGHFHLHLLFDYGDIDAEDPGLTPSAPWPRRVDPFSTFRSGFDIRCARRCARVLMLHHFDGLRMVDDAPLPVVVRSLQLGYEDDPAGARLLTATLRGWRWADGAGGSPGAYSTLDSPALTFGYTQAVIDHAVHEVEGTADLPGGVDRRLWRWVDLDADGLPGLLAESGGQWLYKRNEGGRLAPARVLTSRPTLSLADPQVRIADLDGGGELGFVLTRRELAGTLHRADDGTWGALRPFRSLPTAALRNEGVRLIDLDGDGRADLMVTEDDAIIWYPSAGRDGWGPSWLRNRMSRDEALAPRVLWQNDGEGLFLADMTGDGLTDIVRVRNSTVDYWPNRGYGRFGARVRMGEAPSLSPSRHHFDSRRVRLADVDGAGPADLLYIGADGVRVWRNLSGNRFGAPQTIRSLPCAHDPDGVQVTDLRGDGTATLLWATSLPRDAGKPLRAVHLMAAGKPYLLASVDNGRGRVTRFSYAPSTQFYLADRRAGRPWATRLPFPVQVLTRVESRDHITGWKFVQTYSYHHGTYDGAEREFRGFGLVVQRDAESFADFEDPSVANAELITHQPPVCTKTWFHTGVWRKGKALAAAFATEWWQGDAEVSTAGAAAQLALPRVEDETGGVFATHPLRRPLTDAEHREAHRALKGQLLRQEVYAEDGTPSASVPYQVTTHSYRVRRVQAGARPGTAVFRSFSEQVLQRDYDRIANDPRTRHTCTLEVDAEGFVRSQAVLSYPRRAARSPSAEQAVLDVILSETTLLHQTDQVGYAGGAATPHGGWHLGLPVRARSFALTGPLGWTDLALATPEAIRATLADEDLVEVDFSATPDPAIPTVRLLGDQRTRYLDATATTPSPLPYGEVGPRAIAYDAHVLAMTSALVDQVYDSRITLTALLADTGCVSLPTGASGASDDGQVWLPSGRLVLDPDRFYLPLSHIDPFGATTTLTWDALGFGLAAVEDPLGYETTANLDLQALAPTTATDKHGTTEAVLLDPHGRVLAMCRSSVTSTGTEGETDFAAPTTRFFYDDHRFADDGLPNRAVVEARERHGASPTYQREVAYFDGGGGVVQVKGRAAPGPAPARDSAGALVFDGGALVMAEADPRYVGSGRVQVDNKGNPIKQYEPFFSSTEEYESEADVVEWGVSPVFAYDPLGRNTQVTLPDGNVRTVRYNPWRVEQRDEEDHTVGGAHFDTPGVTHLDAQGRPYRSDAYLRAASSPFEADGTTPFDPDTSPDVLRTTVQVDVQGNPTAVVDPRGNTIQVQVFDLVGRPLFTGAADEGYTPSNGQGEARVLADAAGQPVHLWRSGNTAGITNERKTTQAYDLVRRPTVQTLTDGTATPRVTELRSYGELGGAPTTGRLAGRLFRLFDTAGLMEVSAYDLRGAPITLRRQVLADLTSAADWSTLVSATTVSAQNTATASLLDARSWPLDRSYDALGRLLWEDAPDADSAGANRSRTTPSYDVGGRLVRVEATVRGATTATVFVSDIAYNARGQRESITYGEGATSSTTTTYTYDPQRLWLTRLRTVRAADSAILQDLQYSRDHVGNVIEIDDEAQQTHWFDNAQVSPERTYSYDPLYRLSSATGREKVGLAQAGVLPFPVELLPHGGAANTVLRRYTQSYVYDAAGNLTETVHVAGGSVVWRRRAQVAAGNNQVLASSSGLTGEDIDDPSTWFSQYSHDRRGNMLVLPGEGAPNGMVATRDHRDHLESVALNSTDSAHYTYDGAGQRIAKVVDKGQFRHTTLTIWGIEHYTKHNMAGSTPVLEEERGTLHIMDDQQRIALVETRTVTTTGTTTTVHGHAPAPLVRFQLGDLLATACVELDGSFGVLSYEELHPYGTTAWWAEDGALEVSKRYRFTGMERDEETGLQYHSQRYYCPWLGRWDRPDPIGLGDGGNRWAYVKGRVTTGRDESGLGDEQRATTRKINQIATSIVLNYAFNQVQGAQPTRSPEKPTFASETYPDGDVLLSADILEHVMPMWAKSVESEAAGHTREHGGLLWQSRSGETKYSDSLWSSSGSTGPSAALLVAPFLRKLVNAHTHPYPVKQGDGRKLQYSSGHSLSDLVLMVALRSLGGFQSSLVLSHSIGSDAAPFVEGASLNGNTREVKQDLRRIIRSVNLGLVWKVAPIASMLVFSARASGGEVRPTESSQAQIDQSLSEIHQDSIKQLRNNFARVAQIQLWQSEQVNRANAVEAPIPSRLSPVSNVHDQWYERSN